MQAIDQNATVEDLKKRYCSNCNSYDGLRCRACNIYDVICDVEDVPPVLALTVDQIKDYLQARLDEWNALGDRKYEPANMWGYNFICACFDDLEEYTKKPEGDK